MWLSLIVIILSSICGGIIFYSGLLRNILSRIFTNWAQKHLVQVHQQWYIISYPYGVNWYKIMLPKVRKPVLINSIVDNNGLDIKTNILSFLGPGYNCHGLMITPKMLGYNKITINYGINPIEKSFEENTPILLT